jgi:hypothetical protein
VTYDDHDNLIRWHGWNFVDYRDLDFIPDDLVHLDANPWYDFVGARQQAPSLHVDQHSWTIRGAEARYQSVRDVFLKVLTHPDTRLA